MIKEFLHIPVRVKPVMRLKNSVYRERKYYFFGYPDGTQLYVGKKLFFSFFRMGSYLCGKGFKDYHFDRFGTHAKYTAEKYG